MYDSFYGFKVLSPPGDKCQHCHKWITLYEVKEYLESIKIRVEILIVSPSAISETHRKQNSTSPSLSLPVCVLFQVFLFNSKVRCTSFQINMLVSIVCYNLCYYENSATYDGLKMAK